MKPKSYTLHFKGGPITVQAFNREEAKILAQAEAIKRGWDYTIREKVDINNLPKEFDFKSNINLIVSRYHAVEGENDYLVTSDGGGLWHFDKAEIHSRLLKGEYEIII